MFITKYQHVLPVLKFACTSVPKKVIILEDDVIKSKSVTELFNTEKNCKEY